MTRPMRDLAHEARVISDWSDVLWYALARDDRARAATAAATLLQAAEDCLDVVDPRRKSAPEITTVNGAYVAPRMTTQSHQTIRAKVTGVRNGLRFYREVVRVIDPSRTELGFLPGDGDRPTQARVFVYAMNERLGRYDLHPDLVVQDSIEVVAP